ncbi:hypothetical protein [Kingella oralis]
MAQHQTVLFFRLPTILVNAKGSLKTAQGKNSTHTPFQAASPARAVYGVNASQ